MYDVKYTHQYQLWNEVDGDINCITSDAQPVFSEFQWKFVQHGHLEFENPIQLNAALIYGLYITHSDIKLDLDYEDDQIRRA